MAKEYSKGRIKMSIRTKADYPNTAWYSFKAYDDKEDRFIIDYMLKNFKKNPLYEVVQVLIFYDTKTDVEIERYSDEKSNIQ